MNSVEKVKAICKERKIPISRLERECGFSNGYIASLKRGVFTAEKLQTISDYLDVPIERLYLDEDVIVDSFTITYGTKDDIRFSRREQRRVSHYLRALSEKPERETTIRKILNLSDADYEKVCTMIDLITTK